MKRFTSLSLSLQQRIFIAVGLFVGLTLGIIWIFIRPSYERTVVEERTTIVQQIQQYAVQTSDEKFAGWINVNRFLAYQAESQPRELNVAMRQNIALKPNIIQIIVSSPDVNDELVVTNTEYTGFRYLPPLSGWMSSKNDSTTMVQLDYDAVRSAVLFSVRNDFRMGGKRFSVTTIANANDIVTNFTKIPIDGEFGSMLHAGNRIIYKNNFAGDSALIPTIANVNLLRTVKIGGENFLVLSSEFRSIPYSSTILLPEELFLRPVRTLFYYSAVLILGLMAVVVVLGWIVSYQISKPVSQLVRDVERLSTLDFSKPISPVHLSDLAKIGTTIESMRLVLERYQRINVEKIIFEEWKNKFFLTHSQDMIALTNPDGTYMFMNDRFSQLRTELATTASFKTKDDLLHHPHVHRSKETSATESSSGFNITIMQKELMIEHANKHPQYLRFHDVTIMRGSENLGSLLTLNDLTTDRLIDQMKTDMMNMIAHELRNPLNSVIGFASLILEEDSIDEEEQKKYLGIIQSSGRTMNQLITRFLDVQRLESGTANYQKEEIDFVEIVEMVALSQKPMLLDKSLSITVKKHEQIPTIMAAPELMREAVLNLVSNAIKYGDENRTIEIDLKHENSAVIFTITDHGYGISAEDQEKLFSKFFRVTSNKKAAHQIGTGLGLAHVKEVAKFHGGDISLESNAELGCRFTLTIPVSKK